MAVAFMPGKRVTRRPGGRCCTMRGDANRLPTKDPVPMLPQSSSPESRPLRRTQAQRREEAEQRMLEAARRIVAEKGSLKMSLSDVGVAAGYSRGQPTHHFGSKAALMRALALYIQRHFENELAKATKVGRGYALLEALVTFYFGRSGEEWINTRAALTLLVESFQNESNLSDIMRQYNRTWCDFLATHISIAVADGDIAPGVNPELLASVLLGTLRGVMLQWIVEPGSVDLAGASNTLMALLSGQKVRGSHV